MTAHTTVGSLASMTSRAREALPNPEVVSRNEAAAKEGFASDTPTLALEGISLAFGGVKALTTLICR